MGKLTVLYDGSAWLELLRVHPDFQRQGMGKAIYRRYLEQVAAFGCPSARMYTGVKNVASAALAEQFGLHRGPEFRGMSLPVQDDSFQSQPKPLHLLGGEEAAEYLLPLQEKTGGFLSINHTFYKLNRSTCFGFAAAGWVYGDGEGSVLVCGARFQPQKALYIAALAAPDKAKKENALSFACNLAVMTGAEKLTVHFPNQDQQEQTSRSRNSIRRTASPSTRRTTWCMSGKRQKGASDRYGRNDNGAGLQRGGEALPAGA